MKTDKLEEILSESVIATENTTESEIKEEKVEEKINDLLACCSKNLDFKKPKIDREEEKLRAYVPEIAECDDCKAYFEKRPGNEFAYKRINDKQRYICTKCNGEIQGVRVAHPVWIKGMRMAGTGECRYEDVPYCPSCEAKPSSSGVPVYTAF